MSGKNYINKLKLERERSTLKVFMFVKKNSSDACENWKISQTDHK